LVYLHISMNNRGRFQAQGKKLEESENWAQEQPLKLEEGLILHAALKNKLKPKDLRLRYEAFNDCENFIKRAAENGGIDVTNFPYKFAKTWVVYGKERVDLEIHAGIVFIKDQK
jgi:hypothetical protein